MCWTTPPKEVIMQQYMWVRSTNPCHEIMYATHLLEYSICVLILFLDIPSRLDSTVCSTSSRANSVHTLMWRARVKEIKPEEAFASLLRCELISFSLQVCICSQLGSPQSPKHRLHQGGTGNGTWESLLKCRPHSSRQQTFWLKFSFRFSKLIIDLKNSSSVWLQQVRHMVLYVPYVPYVSYC